MNKEKQIEEMAKVMCKNYGGCSNCMFFPYCDVKAFAIRLYDAGYRKASEVAREIFEEIEQATKNHGITYTQRKIAELKKKYTEENK